jgi:1,4-alpha-glucan branching enzyme
LLSGSNVQGPEEDVILDVVCFGACEACIVPMEVEVVFKVDLSNEEISPDGVHIAGSFQGWSTIDTEMIPQGNKIFYYTTYLLAGYYYEYKFINGIDWEGAEIIPAECSSIDGNRL